jgi:hypothetical protein
MGYPKPDPKYKQKCVAAQVEFKDIFDKNLKDPIENTIKDTIQPLVDATNGWFNYDKNCKDGWMIRVVVTSLEADDPKNPTSIKLKMTLGGVPSDGGKGFSADAKSNADGIRAKKLEKDVTEVVGGVVTKSLTKDVLPTMVDLEQKRFSGKP